MCTWVQSTITTPDDTFRVHKYVSKILCLFIAIYNAQEQQNKQQMREKQRETGIRGLLNIGLAFKKEKKQDHTHVHNNLDSPFTI